MPGFNIAMAVANCARHLVAQQKPELEDLLPLNRQFHFQHHRSNNGWFVLRVQFIATAQMIVGPKMDEPDIEFVREKIGTQTLSSLDQLHGLLGNEWVGFNCFTYVGPYNGDHVSLKNIQERVVEWLNITVLPLALEHNRKRILQAIPAPPQFEPGPICNSLWVIESNDGYLQGTGFDLAEVGIVTCAHVLGTTPYAFRANNFAKKYPIEILASHKTIDLAIVKVAGEMSVGLRRGSAAALQLMDHLLVAGHPNYYIGDSGFLMPGIAVGFRTKSGIRRIVTNAPIVRGASGGPVVDASGMAIGVAVTGADNFSVVSDTEDIGVIPIDALDLIGPH